MCVDEKNIAMLKDLMGEDFSALVDTFIRDSAQKIEQMNTALLAQNAEQLRQSAHGLKGSALNLSAAKLTDLCLTLENMGRDCDLTGADQLVKAIDAEYKAVTGYLVSA